ncbi:MAG: hypothetical protein LQ346_003476 [Caloplaca aetnensis]|nr:MAG: hypothetical protein LQ346_003476 [Caloplaca aetnensis]
MSPASTEQEGAANILPIPPALEFPFPRNSADSSTLSPTLASTKTSSPTTSPETFATPATQIEPTKPSSTAVASTNSRPAPGKRSFTERPVTSQKRSLGPLKRGTTGEGLTALTKAARQSDSDTSPSSSDDDEALPTLPTNGHKRTRFRDQRKTTPRKPDYGRFSVGNENFKTRGKVSKTSGRLDISVNETANKGYLAKALGATLHHHLGSIRKPAEAPEVPGGPPISDATMPMSRPTLENRVSTVTGIPVASQTTPKPKLNIVVMVIGSRGDIQPFLKVGKLLKEEHGHRVRIATHPAFKRFVEEDSGLEFFSVGGDPAELMAFMVKNPGLIPSLSTVKAGEIGRKRGSMFEMFQGFWRACINATDDENDPANVLMMEKRNPFVADAIIANPPSFAHVHCAERLGIPLHLMFTFPYSPTQQFPHPLANIRNTNVDTNYTNFMSYPLVEMM